MNLTVIGKYGPYPAAGGATSGYLVSEKRTNIMLDFGSGILSRVQEYLPITSISAIILSHLHSDHISDMSVLRYALAQMQQQNKGRGNLPLKVFAPDSPRLDYTMLLQQNVFELITIRDGLRVHLGDLEMSFHRMSHPVPSYATLVYADKKVLAYTGDTSLNDELAPFAMGADLLLADTNLMSYEKTNVMAPHLTAAEAAAIAVESGVKRLICTHISPLKQEEEILLEASEIFQNTEIAQEMTTYEV